MKEQIILNNKDIEKIIGEFSEHIYNDIKHIDRFAVVGIQTRGVELAKRIKEKIDKLSGESIRSGFMDITFYRDDLATKGVLPIIKETRIDFNISNLTILLVDDVMFTGRTTKAALETLTSFGRPSAIRLFILVDRGNRELPIQPDYCGYKLKTDLSDNIRVMLSETDQVEDAVILCSDN